MEGWRQLYRANVAARRDEQRHTVAVVLVCLGIGGLCLTMMVLLAFMFGWLPLVR